MSVIKLNAIDSTNNYIKALVNEQSVPNYTVVVTEHQTNGRGQMGAVWTSESSKNLMFSMFLDTSKMHLEYPFYISIATALAIKKSLVSFSIPSLSIKWPNDILSHHKKICGVLIENVIKQSKIEASVIGIGLNVNQTRFDDLPNASSLKNITGTVYDLEELLYNLIENLKYYFSILKQGDLNDLRLEYEASLFRKDKPSTFKDAEGNLFSGFIKTVSDYGNLQVLLEDEILKEYSLKEITLLY